jgi:sugar O-acyltransferase (sialic acid O-acetyltransferase NeuD family)
MEKILIIGAGGHGRSVAEAIILAGKFRIAGFLDDDHNVKRKVWDYPVFGPLADLEKYKGLAQSAVVAIGNNSIREKLFNSAKIAGFNLPSIIHSEAFVSPTAVVGKGSCIMARAVIGTEAVIGDGCIVNVNASVDHHCKLEDFAHLGVGVHLAGGVRIGTSAWMQAGSSAGYNVEVAPEANILPGTGLYRVDIK